MPAPVFTTNDSEISRLEGLYIVERNPPAVISGISLNGVGVVGDAIRGPVDKAVPITSEARFKEVFGGRDYGSGGAVASSLWKALSNKPFGKLVVVRAAAAGAAAATLTVKGALAATGSIQCISKANHVDAETVTISDGATSKVFEFDKAGDGVSGGNVQVNISTATSAADCAAILNAAINATAFNVSSTISGSVLTLTNDNAGVAGNVAITETVTNGGFTVTGMSGGTASGSNVMQVSASSVGQWGNNVTLEVAAATDGDADHFNLTVTYLGQDYVYKNLDLSDGNDNTLATIGSDDGNVVTVTKLAAGRPGNSSSLVLAGGSNGTIADADFTASNRGLNALTNYPGLGCVFIAERTSAALRSAMSTAAASATDRMFLVCADSETTGVSSAATDAGSYRSDRVIYCYNHPYTLDNETATEMLTHPTAWMASVLAQVDVDIHPGEEDTKAFTAGITRLYQPNLAREDYISLREGGICALENDEGFAFVSGVTTSLVPGKEQITRRRMADYLQGAVAKTLKFSVKKKNTFTRKQTNAAMIEAFLDDLKKAERVVNDFKVDPDVLNTPAQEALGVVKILMRVKLIGHILELVLETEIGTAVTIKQVA